MKKALGAAAAVATLLPAVVAAGPVVNPPHPPWDTTQKCVSEDWQGRRIPTRVGNSELGWRHFSGPHNVKSCELVNAAVDGNPDKRSDHDRNLEYRGSAIYRRSQVDFVVVVRYAQATADGRHIAPGGKKAKVGVITAYCRGVQKCPSWVN
ncbi:hypothetical protein ACE1SV_62310 [Streptomyces sp. E-15]